MSGLDLIPAGTTFSADEITHWQGKTSGGRTLEQAISQADVLVTTPHSGSAIPEEIAEFISPALTRRLQNDFSDVATAGVVKRWAEIDPRIVAVINPHPRLVRDPNRAKPDDVRAKLAEAIARVRAAGPWQRVDLTGVDAIRPVTFSFFPIIEIPENSADLDRLVDAFATTAQQGVDVYQRTCEDLVDRFVARGLEHGGSFTRLSFHDTMNTTTTREGAVNVERLPQDRLPRVVALSNRGDARGESRGPDDPPTMLPAALRRLAESHREGFQVREPEDVALNQPYLGSQEILVDGQKFRDLAEEARAAGLVLGAVQAEFLREFLLGEAATKELHRPGIDWVDEDQAHIDTIARSCMRSWNLFRESA